MKAIRVKAADSELINPVAAFWNGLQGTDIDMYPVPLVMVEEVSPFLARSTGHGVIKRLQMVAAHNGLQLAVRLSWMSGRHDTIKDLNQFVDGVAVMLPLSRAASALTMGAKGAPVSAWLWRANRPAPFTLLAESFASVVRLPADEGGDLVSAAHYQDGRWLVVFRRALQGVAGQPVLVPGQSSRIAFAAWDGGNAERSGRKSFSGEFVAFDLDK